MSGGRTGTVGWARRRGASSAARRATAGVRSPELEAATTTGRSSSSASQAPTLATGGTPKRRSGGVGRWRGRPQSGMKGGGGGALPQLAHVVSYRTPCASTSKTSGGLLCTAKLWCKLKAWGLTKLAAGQAVSAISSHTFFSFQRRGATKTHAQDERQGRFTKKKTSRKSALKLPGKLAFPLAPSQFLLISHTQAAPVETHRTPAKKMPMDPNRPPARDQPVGAESTPPSNKPRRAVPRRRGPR